jgi:sterol desaturase/sphingolipid hydroxylase (fatty acid hydroxylase superfamily)
MSFNIISLLPSMMLNSSYEKLNDARFDVFQYLSIFYGSHDGEFEMSKLLRSFVSHDFALFAYAYYTLYLFMAGLITAVAVFIFKVDYCNINYKQLKREALLTFEAVTTNAFFLWAVLKYVPSWSSDIDVFEIAASYVININVFLCWFYVSHRMWHSNRIIYKYVHEHHHQSTIVCPLTALSNTWLESVWTQVGFAIGPIFLGANNVWGWYISIACIVFIALIGHSRIPYSLEHATHHTIVTKNFGFYWGKGNPWKGTIVWDSVFGTWAYASEVQKVKKVYPEESTLYSWNEKESMIHWDNVDKGKSNSNKLE